MYKRIYILLLLMPFNLFAQLDTFYILANTQPLKFNNDQIGKNNHALDSNKIATERYNSVKNLLANHTHVFVKNYGTNNLSTLSVRGSNASQIAVLWNGLNLNMLSMSQLDMNLMPSFFVDKLDVSYGASSTEDGSGAIGATVSMQSNLSLNQGSTFFIGHQTASFGANTTTTKYCFSNKKIASSTKLLYNNAINNFPYYINGLVQFGKEKMTNNHFLQSGVLQENKFVLDTRHTLITNIWWQNTMRELPPSITSNNNNETQSDKHTRFLANVIGDYGRYKSNTSFAFSEELLQYTNPIISVNDKYITTRFVLENKHLYTTKYGNFSGAIQYNYGKINSERYVGNAYQNRLNGQLSYQNSLFKNKLQTLISARQEFATAFKIPLVFAVNASYAYNKNWKFNTVINTMFRLPTFNDLFWAGAGNLNLKSENGTGIELGIDYLQTSAVEKNKGSFDKITQSKNRDGRFNLSTTIFSRTVYNWILWTPDASNIWRPENILQVWSRGLEITAKQSWVVKKTKLELRAMYTFVKSTNEKVDAVRINTLQQQLTYTPEHLANANFQINTKGWIASWQQQIVGKRYTSSDNENSLPTYWVSNVQVSKSLLFNGYLFNVASGVNNIWNQNYQTIAFRAMPLRSYFVSLHFQIHKKIKNKK